jgi:lipopolysaccharide export system protein LptA
LIAAALTFPGVLNAQPATTAVAAKGPPNALQGFSQNRDEPVHIESATLEVRDKDKVATFSGDVRVKQGDTGMRSKTLVVFYEGGESAGGGKSMPAATPGPGGEQKIKRLEARGNVVVTQKEQTATGDLGIFDMKSNVVTLTGNVMMTQGKNGTGRVQGLFLPGSQPGAAVPDAPKPAEPRHSNGPAGTVSRPLQLKPPN